MGELAALVLKCRSIIDDEIKKNLVFADIYDLIQQDRAEQSRYYAQKFRGNSRFKECDYAALYDDILLAVIFGDANRPHWKLWEPEKGSSLTSYIHMLFCSAVKNEYAKTTTQKAGGQTTAVELTQEAIQSAQESFVEKTVQNMWLLDQLTKFAKTSSSNAVNAMLICADDDKMYQSKEEKLAKLCEIIGVQRDYNTVHHRCSRARKQFAQFCINQEN